MTSLFFSLAFFLFNLQVKTWGKKLWSTLRASESRNLSKITCLRVIDKSFFSQIISINLFFFLHHANWVPLSPSLSHWWPRFQYCAAASPDTNTHAPWHTPLPRKHVLLITRLKHTWCRKKNPQKTRRSLWRAGDKNHSNLQIYPTSTLRVQRYVDFLMSTLLRRGALLDGARD